METHPLSLGVDAGPGVLSSEAEEVKIESGNQHKLEQAESDGI